MAPTNPNKCEVYKCKSSYNCWQIKVPIYRSIFILAPEPHSHIDFLSDQFQQLINMNFQQFEIHNLNWIVCEIYRAVLSQILLITNSPQIKHHCEISCHQMFLINTGPLPMKRKFRPINTFFRRGSDRGAGRLGMR